jgi:hypothetical protein
VSADGLNWHEFEAGAVTNKILTCNSVDSSKMALCIQVRDCS